MWRVLNTPAALTHYILRQIGDAWRICFAEKQITCRCLRQTCDNLTNSWWTSKRRFAFPNSKHPNERQPRAQHLSRTDASTIITAPGVLRSQVGAYTCAYFATGTFTPLLGPISPHINRKSIWVHKDNCGTPKKTTACWRCTRPAGYGYAVQILSVTPMLATTPEIHTSQFWIKNYSSDAPRSRRKNK